MFQWTVVTAALATCSTRCSLLAPISTTTTTTPPLSPCPTPCLCPWPLTSPTISHTRSHMTHTPSHTARHRPTASTHRPMHRPTASTHRPMHRPTVSMCRPTASMHTASWVRTWVPLTLGLFRRWRVWVLHTWCPPTPQTLWCHCSGHTAFLDRHSYTAWHQTSPTLHRGTFHFLCLAGGGGGDIIIVVMGLYTKIYLVIKSA